MTEANLGPKVSVIVPFLNPGNFLREAIESVLAQTYQSWELILVDDGSTDHSTAVAKAFASKSNGCITYLEHPGHENKGMPASRNLGIKYSRGQYIVKLDSDDIWRENLLEELVSILDNYPSVAMTFGPMKVWYSWDRIHDSPSDWIQSFTFSPDKKLSPPSFVPLLLTEKNDPQGFVIRRNVLDDVGLYEESQALFEDWALIIKIALKYEIFPTGRCLYWYRQHSAQYCSRQRRAGKFYRENFIFIAWLKSYLVRLGCDNLEVWSAVSRFKWRSRFNRATEFARYMLKSIQTKVIK